jgi:hypothetical protein
VPIRLTFPKQSLDFRQKKVSSQSIDMVTSSVVEEDDREVREVASMLRVNSTITALELNVCLFVSLILYTILTFKSSQNYELRDNEAAVLSRALYANSSIRDLQLRVCL